MTDAIDAALATFNNELHSTSTPLQSHWIQTTNISNHFKIVPPPASCANANLSDLIYFQPLTKVFIDYFNTKRKQLYDLIKQRRDIIWLQSEYFVYNSSTF